jgi:hypothetical protein
MIAATLQEGLKSECHRTRQRDGHQSVKMKLDLKE